MKGWVDLRATQWHAKVKYHFFISCKSFLPKFIASIKNIWMICHPGCCRMKFIFFIFVEVVFIFQLGILFVNLNLCYLWCITKLVYLTNYICPSRSSVVGENDVQQETILKHLSGCLQTCWKHYHYHHFW